MDSIKTVFRLSLIALVVAGLFSTPTLAQKSTLVVALNQDPDVIDPTLSRTYVGRIIYANMCEKLYDIDENLNISPQLAAAMPSFSNGGKTVTIKLRRGVKFNDGTPMNAQAVKFSLDRHRSMKGSNRRSELKLITNVQAVGSHTIRISLSKSFSPIVGAFVDRSGMPVSPRQAKKLGQKFGTAPICVGPWTLTERVSQDRIVLEKSRHYFNQSQANFKKIIFRIIPNDSVRLANLRSGDIDIMHLVGPTDAAALKREGKFQVVAATGMGYQGITVNIGNKTGKRKPPGNLGTPLANDPRVREALELSIDRNTLNRVAWDGQYTPGCTPLSPVSPYFDKSNQCSTRNISKAKGLMAAAGLSGGYSFELMVVNNPQQRRVGQIIQGMASEAGFKISLRPTEFASGLKDFDAGKYQGFLIGWSGRVDPDANIHQFHSCGGTLNQSNVCDKGIDAELDAARQRSLFSQRLAHYKKAVNMFTRRRRNIIYLYHLNYIVAFPKNLKGYKATPDGMIRLKGVRWQ